MDSFEEQDLKTITKTNSEKPEFSFNDNEKVEQKYLSLTDQLNKLQKDDLIELLVEEIQQNENSKNKILNLNLKIQNFQCQFREIENQLSKKRQAIKMLCESQSRNINLIEKLQVKIRNPSDIDKQSYFQKKYRQLSINMSQYVNNISEAEKQFQKQYSMKNNENQRLCEHIEKINTQAIELQMKNQILKQQLKKTQTIFDDFTKQHQRLSKQIERLEQINQNVSKQVQVQKQIIETAQKVQQEKEVQISTELDVLRQKMSENEIISRQIIINYEQKQQQYQIKLNQNTQLEVKFHQLLSSNQLSKQKIYELQIENTSLRNQNQSLCQRIQKVEAQYCKKEIEFKRNAYELKFITAQKQEIHKELLDLNEKLQSKEMIHKKQMMKSQKIKEELHKFWLKKQQTRELKQQSLNILGENNAHRKESIQNSINQESYCKSHLIKTKMNRKIQKSNKQNH